MEKLEGVQREAARIISGTMVSTPSEAVLEEAGLHELKARGRATAAIALERSRRLEEENPRKQIAERQVRTRLQRAGWRENATTWHTQIFGGRRVQTVFPEPLPPWLVRVDSVFELGGARSESAEENLELCKSKLNTNIEFEVVIYTDGSVAEGGINGGAAAVVTKGPVEELEVLEVLEFPAGRFSSSYQAELLALREALRWLGRRKGEWRKARVVSDSKSSLESVSRYQWSTNNVWLKEIFLEMADMAEEGRLLVFTWVPSHCGLPGNDLADEAAGRASGNPQESTPWLFDTAKAVIRRAGGTRVFQHERVREVYGASGGVRHKAEASWGRGDGTSFRRLRTGHSLELRAHEKRLGATEVGECRRCGLEEEDLRHVIENCPAGEMKRRELGIGGLGDLCTKSEACKTYWAWFRGGP